MARRGQGTSNPTSVGSTPTLVANITWAEASKADLLATGLVEEEYFDTAPTIIGGETEKLPHISFCVVGERETWTASFKRHDGDNFKLPAEYIGKTYISAEAAKAACEQKAKQLMT